MRTVPETIADGRRRGCPFFAINTLDPKATMKSVSQALPDTEDVKVGLVSWDYMNGFLGLNSAGEDARRSQCASGDDSINNPAAAVTMLTKFPAHTVVFWQMSERFLRDDSVFCLPVTQGIWNLRDAFKRNFRTLVLLGSHVHLPPELTQDVILLDEPLPSTEQTREIITKVHANAKLAIDSERLERACEAAQGQSAFAIEQNTALALTADGVDVGELWERKRKQIEQTDGLSVYRGHETFDDIGGVDGVKEHMRSLLRGKRRPSCVVWIDEVDKMLDGQDLTGVSQDQLAVLLQYIQDHRNLGLLYVGPPGTSKSLSAKAMGNEGGILTVQLDLGACKDSLVGGSERKIREALRIITAISNDNALWIATANRYDNLNTALRRRFKYKWFFDLPSEEERKSIWAIHMKAFELKKHALPTTQFWSGSDIYNCCELAWMHDCSLKDAAKQIIPIGIACADEVTRLRAQAKNTLLSASTGRSYDPDESLSTERSMTL